MYAREQRATFCNCAALLASKEPLIKSLGSSVHPRVPCGSCFLLTLNQSFPKVNISLLHGIGMQSRVRGEIYMKAMKRLVLTTITVAIFNGVTHKIDPAIDGEREFVN